MDIDRDGWLKPVYQCYSPNCNERPPESDISLLVIHNISLPPDQYGGGYIADFFCNKLDPSVHPYFESIASLQVSAHCLIDRTGKVTQFVPFWQRAWHAGRSSFEGRQECNDFSIGIELEGSDHVPYTDQQYESLLALSRVLMARLPALTVERIVGHSDIAPGRKTDPGPGFDWGRFRRALQAD